MHSKRLLLVLSIILGFSALLLAAEPDGVPTILKEELQAMLGTPELITIDVRTAADWASSDSKIKGAVREDPSKVKEWAQNYSPQKTLVFYCS